MANKIKLGRGTKARIETVKNNLDDFEIVYATDTDEIGVKKTNGNIEYFYNKTQLDGFFNGKVDKVSGKGLSTNDFTNTLKTKLDGIAAGAEVNVQSDWNITDTANDAFIKNKPAIKTVATTGDYNDLTNKPDLTLKLDKNFTALPNQASPLLTDVLAINRGTVAQKTTLGNLLAQVDSEIFIVTATLPATGVVNKIYLVPKGTPEAQNTYDEFIWVNSAWENLGTVALDLSNYYNKTEVNGLLSSKVDKNNAITAGTKTKITYDAKGLVTGGSDLVATDIPNLDTSKLTTGTLGIARGGTGRTDGYAVGVVETRASVLTKIWAGNQAQYDAIGTKDANTLYFITE